jgi:hypothetical protein
MRGPLLSSDGLNLLLNLGGGQWSALGSQPIGRGKELLPLATLKLCTYELLQGLGGKQPHGRGLFG